MKTFLFVYVWWQIHIFEVRSATDGLADWRARRKLRLTSGFIICSILSSSPEEEKGGKKAIIFVCSKTGSDRSESNEIVSSFSSPSRRLGESQSRADGGKGV